MTYFLPPSYQLPALGLQFGQNDMLLSTRSKSKFFWRRIWRQASGVMFVKSLRPDSSQKTFPNASSLPFLVLLPQDQGVSSYISQFPRPSLNSTCSSPSRCLGTERWGSSQLLRITLPMFGSHGQIYTHFFQPHLCVPGMALCGDRGLGV